MSKLISALAVLAAALVLVACGDDGDDTTTASAPEETTETVEADAVPAEKPEKKDKPKPAAGTEIKLASSQFGEVIFDGSDQAIYLFDKETTSESECYDQCAVEWPPVLTEGKPAAGSGVDEKLLGTTKRDDGTTQVTYNGHPLYYYFDEGPNEVRCHNVPGFGGLWLVLDAEGNAVA